MIVVEVDARGMEVEAVVFCASEALGCLATASGCVCVVRHLAASMRQRRKTAQAAMTTRWLWHVGVSL